MQSTMDSSKDIYGRDEELTVPHFRMLRTRPEGPSLREWRWNRPRELANSAAGSASQVSEKDPPGTIDGAESLPPVRWPGGHTVDEQALLDFIRDVEIPRNNPETLSPTHPSGSPGSSVISDHSYITSCGSGDDGNGVSLSGTKSTSPCLGNEQDGAANILNNLEDVRGYRDGDHDKLLEDFVDSVIGDGPGSYYNESPSGSFIVGRRSSMCSEGKAACDEPLYSSKNWY
jgi:hypothetical protein